jgi:hypothetical protein
MRALVALVTLENPRPMNGFNKLDSRSETRRSAETVYPFIGRGDRGKLTVVQGGRHGALSGLRLRKPAVDEILR